MRTLSKVGLQIPKLPSPDAYISSGLDSLIADTRSRLEELISDPKGMTDPFESIYGIVYQLTMRTVACNEIANDRVLLDETLNMFEKIEAASSPELIIFPWFPFPGKLRRLWYGAKLYMVFKNIIDDRAKTGRKDDDPLQFLIEQGDNVKEILTFILGESAGNPKILEQMLALVKISA